jgi:hypothetical protein
MQFNKFVFPAPKATYNIFTPTLITIPRVPIQDLVESLVRKPLTLSQGNYTIIALKPLVSIPCMFYHCTGESSRIIVYFHANAEDAGLSDDLIYPLKEQLLVIFPITKKIKPKPKGSCFSGRVPGLRDLRREP